MSNATTQPKSLCHKHLTWSRSKNAKRWESLLNCLLCFTTNDWFIWQRTALLTTFQEVSHTPKLTWPPEARNTKRVSPLPCPMRQLDWASTSALSFLPKRRTMANCRGNCQAEMLIGKYAQNGLKPAKFETSRHDLQMKQLANIDMFYGLRNSRNRDDNADLLRQLERMAKGTKNRVRRIFKPMKYK